MPDSPNPSTPDLSRLRIHRDPPATKALRGRGGLVLAVILIAALAAAGTFALPPRPVAVEDAQTHADAAQAQLNSAKAQLKLARANLENTNVRAPFDGTVLRKDAEVGEIVAPSAAGGGLTRTAIVTMANLATLEVEVDVNEAYIAQIGNGQAARITLDAYPDTSFAGQVRQVVPTADRQKATVQVKVSILDRDLRILPEMGAKGEFLHEPKAQPVAVAPRRVTVPSAAVVQGPAGARVWVVEARKV